MKMEQLVIIQIGRESNQWRTRNSGVVGAREFRTRILVSEALRFCLKINAPKLLFGLLGVFPVSKPDTNFYTFFI